MTGPNSVRSEVEGGCGKRVGYISQWYIYEASWQMVNDLDTVPVDSHAFRRVLDYKNSSRL